MGEKNMMPLAIMGAAKSFTPTTGSNNAMRARLPKRPRPASEASTIFGRLALEQTSLTVLTAFSSGPRGLDSTYRSGTAKTSALNCRKPSQTCRATRQMNVGACGAARHAGACVKPFCRVRRESKQADGCDDLGATRPDCRPTRSNALSPVGGQALARALIRSHRQKAPCRALLIAKQHPIRQSYGLLTSPIVIHVGPTW